MLDAFFAQGVFDGAFGCFQLGEVGDDSVECGGIFGGAHRPHMKVVPAFYTRNPADGFLYLVNVDRRRYGIQRKEKTFFQQVDGRYQNDGGNEQADEIVDGVPAGQADGNAGVMMALAIGIHNFPEGLATFTSALANIEVALPIVFAIAIHNIPEGIAVSVPIYHATNSREKAFAYSFLSGMAEPVGALLGFLFLAPFWSDTLNAYLLAFVSGIMVYISFDELLPGTEKYGHHHWGIGGVIAGMAVMAGSLLLL